MTYQKRKKKNKQTKTMFILEVGDGGEGVVGGEGMG